MVFHNDTPRGVSNLLNRASISQSTEWLIQVRGLRFLYRKPERASSVFGLVLPSDPLHLLRAVGRGFCASAFAQVTTPGNPVMVPPVVPRRCSRTADTHAWDLRRCSRFSRVGALLPRGEPLHKHERGPHRALSAQDSPHESNSFSFESWCQELFSKLLCRIPTGCKHAEDNNGEVFVGQKEALRVRIGLLTLSGSAGRHVNDGPDSTTITDVVSETC